MRPDADEAVDGGARAIPAAWGLTPAAAVLALLTTACGGGGSTPSAPPVPTPPAEVFSVAGFVYFDELPNNAVDGDETIRLGDVEVEIAGHLGRSNPTTGAVVVPGVPAGSYPVSIRAASLPPFFVGGSITAQVPSPTQTALPVTLPIGRNVPFRYLASGDSISQGFGSADERGYRTILEARLEGYYGRSVSTFYRGAGGGSSAEGAARIARDLQLLEPAYTLIAWGTNDWNSCGSPSTCFTIPSLRSIVREAKRTSSLPFVATIIPANTGYDGNAPASRTVWVAEANELIKAMAREEGAAVVDLYAAFMKAPNLSSLFVDHVHPNPAGHQLIANTFFEALTRPRSQTGAASHF